MGSTPTSRRSRRLASAKPSGEKPLRRPRRPNTRTLDAFASKQAQIQALVQQQGTGKRKITKISKRLKSIKSLKEALATLICIPSTPTGPISTT
jgi:hypothetical protein